MPLYDDPEEVKPKPPIIQAKTEEEPPLEGAQAEEWDDAQDFPTLEGAGAALGLPQAGLMEGEVAGVPRKKRHRGRTFQRPKVEPIAPDAIVELSKAYPAGEARAFFAALYLTGGRVSEVLGLRVKDVTLQTIEGTPFVSFKLVTLKRGDYPVRTVDVLAKYPVFKALLTPFLDWVNEKRKEGKPEAKIFRYSRTNAREVIHRYGVVKNATAKVMLEGRTERITLPEFRVHPHWLRRCSNTHLVEEFGFTESELTARSMWASPVTAAGYVQLNPKHLAMKQAREWAQRQG